MKRKILQYRFNMIEVMLAIVIIAIGMASTFVLFPVGLNANKQAMAENAICDIAEYITAFVRADCTTNQYLDAANNYTYYVNKSGGVDVKDADYTSALLGKFRSSSDVLAGTGVEEPIAVDDFKGTTCPTGWRVIDQEGGIYTNDAGVYLALQKSGPADNQIVDLAVLGQVYLDFDSINQDYFPATSSAFVKYENMTKEYAKRSDANNNNIINIKKFLLPLVLELSWPADVPFDEREKRYFRFEIFNNLYEPDSGL